MKSEIDAYFTLFGNGMDPDEVSRILGLTPTKIRMPPGSPRYAHKSNRVGFWRLRSKLPKDRELSHQVRDLLDVLTPLAKQIAEVRALFNLAAVIDVVVESYNGDAPAIVVEADLVKRMGELDLAFDVDLYLFNDADAAAESAGASEASDKSDGAPWD